MKILLSVVLAVMFMGCSDSSEAVGVVPIPDYDTKEEILERDEDGYHYDAPTMTLEEIRQNYIKETGEIPCIKCDGTTYKDGSNR